MLWRVNEGNIAQAVRLARIYPGKTWLIYNEPENRFTAQFIGESNIIDGVMKKDFKAEFEGLEFDCVDKGFSQDELVDIVIRPEDIVLSSEVKEKSQVQ